MAQWANVELRLMLVFQFVLGIEGETADAILSTPRNFEIRSAMIHNVMRIRLKDMAALDDWNLVYNHLTKLAGKRNEIAHATMIDDGKVGAIVLKPYFTIFGDRRPHITLEMIRERARDFTELINTLYWFIPHATPHSGPPDKPLPTFDLPIPDLLLRLRIEDAQIREAQRARQKPSPPLLEKEE